MVKFCSRQMLVLLNYETYLSFAGFDIYKCGGADPEYLSSVVLHRTLLYLNLPFFDGCCSRLLYVFLSDLTLSCWSKLL